MYMKQNIPPGYVVDPRTGQYIPAGNMQPMYPQQTQQMYPQQIQQPIYQQQPMYMQQQVMQRPMVRQPMYQQQISTPFQSRYGMQQTVGPNTSSSLYNTNKYDVETSKPIPTVAQPQTFQQEKEVNVEENTEPLPGNEYEPLLADGLEYEIETHGNFFRYDIKGVDMEYNRDEKIVIEFDNKKSLIYKGDQFGLAYNRDDIEIYLKSVVLNNDNIDGMAIDVLLSKAILTKDIDKMEWIKKCDSVKGTLDDVKDYIRKGMSKSTGLNLDYYKYLNKLFTNIITERFKYMTGTDISIDSFIDDYDELMEIIREQLSDKEHKLALQMLESVVDSVQAVSAKELDPEDIKDDVEVEGDFSVTIVPIATTWVYLNHPMMSKLKSKIKFGDVKGITKSSHRKLYNLLEDIRENTNFHKNNKLYLINDGEIYMIMRNLFDYYTIIKVS